MLSEGYESREAEKNSEVLCALQTTLVTVCSLFSSDHVAC